jgi:rhodanese-related sulfurtransferase
LFEQNVIIPVLLLAIAALFIYRRFLPIRGVRNVSATEFTQAISEGRSSAMLIDVRESYEYKGGHISGAVNMPLSQLSSRMKEIPADKQLLVYCQSGMRSRQAARMLARRGFTDIINLSGGIMSWRGETSR